MPQGRVLDRHMSCLNAVECCEEAVEPEKHDVLARASYRAQTDVLKDLIAQAPSFDHQNHYCSTVPCVSVRAEHLDLRAFLEESVRSEDVGRVGFVSFTQWPFALAALAESALTFQDMGSQITLAFWSTRTPMKDTGWGTYAGLARFFGGRTTDEAVRESLIAAGVPATGSVDPPIKAWRPHDAPRITRPLNRSAIRTLSYRGSPMGRAMLQIRPDTETPITDRFFWPRRLLQAAATSYAWAYDQTSALIRDRNLDLLVVYNGRFLHDRAAAAAGEAAGISVWYYDSGGIDTDFELTDSITHDWSDLQRRMLVMYDEWPTDLRDEVGESWFTDRINHAAPDNSLFVEAQESGHGIQRPDVDVVVVYFSSSGDEIAELELDWSRFLGDQPRALQALADEVRKRPNWALVVRSHPHKRMKPKDDVAEWIIAVEAAKPDVHIDHHSSVDSYTLMRQADIVVTYGSTTGVEAAYAGKPVIVMGPSAYDELGCATFAGTEAELARALDEAQPGSWSGAVSYGLMMRRRGLHLKHVELRDGMYFVGGRAISDPPKVAQHISHALHRVWRWYSERR